MSVLRKLLLHFLNVERKVRARVPPLFADIFNWDLSVNGDGDFCVFNVPEGFIFLFILGSAPVSLLQQCTNILSQVY